MADYPAKYQALIDAETWAFIERTNQWYPPETATFSIERQREIYDAMCREFFAGYPDGVTADTGEITGIDGNRIPVRRYSLAGREPFAHIVYYHGGGFVVGGLESHDDVCAELCARTGFGVTSIDYRMAPENPFPACYHDALAGYEQVRDSFAGPILLCGDSAGGNLAAAVTHARRTDNRIAGQVLIYPGLGGDMTAGSFAEHAEAPMLTMADLDFYRDVRGGGKSLAGDKRAAPLADTDFSGLPSTFIVTAQCDPLASDGPAYVAKIKAAGGKAECVEEAGLVHGYLRARNTVGRARASFDRIVGTLSGMGKAARKAA